jgi:hypothetical protein
MRATVPWSWYERVVASITIVKEVAAPAATVWALLADFGNVSWIPLAEDVVVEGSGPGMRRHIRGGGPDPVVERLVSIDPDRHTLAYSIDENNPMPVHRYEATVRVGADGDNRAVLTWDVSFEPSGDEREALIAIEGIYGMMAGWLEAAANASR